jgi:hypothetical protein
MPRCRDAVSIEMDVLGVLKFTVRRANLTMIIQTKMTIANHDQQIVWG